MFKKLIEMQKYEFIFVTLTSRMSLQRDQKKKLEIMQKLLNVFKLKAFDNMNVGYIRKLELTYNKDRNDYNPHYHLIVCIKKLFQITRLYKTK